MTLTLINRNYVNLAYHYCERFAALVVVVVVVVVVYLHDNNQISYRYEYHPKLTPCKRGPHRSSSMA